MTVFEITNPHFTGKTLYIQFSLLKGVVWQSSKPSYEEQIEDIQQQLDRKHTRIKLIIKK